MCHGAINLRALASRYTANHNNRHASGRISNPDLCRCLRNHHRLVRMAIRVWPFSRTSCLVRSAHLAHVRHRGRVSHRIHRFRCESHVRVSASRRLAANSLGCTTRDWHDAYRAISPTVKNKIMTTMQRQSDPSLSARDFATHRPALDICSKNSSHPSVIRSPIAVDLRSSSGIWPQ